MRQTVCLLAGVLLVVPLLGSDSPKEYDGATEADNIQGTWQLIEVMVGDLKIDHHFQMVRTYCRGTYTDRGPDGRTMHGSYRVCPERTPPSLDDMPSDDPHRGQVFKWIYRIEGDTLRVASRKGDDRSRPRGFDDEGLVVFTYKRVK